MNRTFLTSVVVLFGIAALAAFLTLFTVQQTQQALVLEFGKPKREIKDPGLHYKIPFIQNVEYFDKRMLGIDTASQEVIASDKKRLVVDAFARYRITDPLKFFQSVRDERIANSRIGAILEASLRRVLGGASFQTVVRDKRDQLMRTILSQVNQEAAEFGVEIVDVRIKRVDLPEANMQAIYRRMQTERQREAAEFRAEGEGASRRIRGTADRQVTVIKADATGESERIRGDGDAERNRIYAEAYNQDPGFFGFYRSMKAYEASLKSGDTRMLLSPDSQFFRYFNDAAGQPGLRPDQQGRQPGPPATTSGPAPEATAPSAQPRAELGAGSVAVPEAAAGNSEPGEPNGQSSQGP
jgi:modulator of FtsH protease HflC